MKPTKGKLIVLCGTDGSGKATQTELLFQHLQKEHFSVEKTDFPQYGKPSTAMVEQYLNGAFGTAEQVGPYRASLFYTIDRYAASFQMKEWLKQGKTIVSNRYVSANLGHQGGKIQDPIERKKFIAWINEIEYNIFQVPKPDLTLFLHIPSEIAQTLVDKKQSRNYLNGKKRDIHEDDINHLKNAEQAYLEICSHDPSWKKVSCTQQGKVLSKGQIHDMIWKIVLPLLQ